MDDINLKSNAPKNVINVTSDASVYYANVAKEAANSATQSAQIATEKAQVVEDGAQTALNSIDELKSSSLSSIETLADTSTSEINTLKTSSLTEMTSEKTTALESITQAESEALASIASASANFADKDLSNITDNGKDVIRTLASETSSSGGGGGSWGSITGTLNDQTDLAEVLANKLDADYSNSEIPYIVEIGGRTNVYNYRRWSDGFLEQMGKYSTIENTSSWISFPLPFSNTMYSCLVGAHYDGLEYTYGSTSGQEKNAYGVWTYQKNVDECGITNYGPAGEVFWYAYGKGATTS